jgi:phosphoribosyl 1,2-cyclic phosphodiesterase
MSLYTASLNSGSNGNCYYVANEREAVLIDAGISCRETEKRMNLLGLSVKKVRAIFISHEHSDHINGAEVLSRKYSIPVYITKGTLKGSRLKIEKELLSAFTAYERVNVGGLSVLAFPKFHDAADPHSFVVSGNGVNIGIFTDIGKPCNHVIESFSQCHAAFLETNYDDQMLDSGNYPIYLKKRIKGDDGHLSNAQALELFLKHKASHLSHVFLSHLSKDNNRPELVQQLFDQHRGNTFVTVASRYEASNVFHIKAHVNTELGIRRSAIYRQSDQMKLFGE